MEITNEKEYEDALERISCLMDGDHALDSKEGKELDALATIVEQYENIHYPMGVEEKIAKLNQYKE